MSNDVGLGASESAGESSLRALEGEAIQWRGGRRVVRAGGFCERVG
jgi:hypothetical protein